MCGRRNGAAWKPIVCILAAGITCAVTGCGPQRGPGPISADIVEVNKFYAPEPWISFDGSRTPQGFKVGSLYLVPAGATKGVFGDGTIRVVMRVVPKERGGTVSRQQVKTWEFDGATGRPLSSTGGCIPGRRETSMGWGYQLHLPFEDADVYGKEIEVEIEFERKDGRIIHSQPQTLLVPTTQPRG